MSSPIVHGSSPVPASMSVVSNGPLDFGSAMAVVAEGGRVTKAEWNDPRIFVMLENNLLTLVKADGSHHQLMVSLGDLIGKDYYILIRA